MRRGLVGVGHLAVARGTGRSGQGGGRRHPGRRHPTCQLRPHRAYLPRTRRSRPRPPRKPAAVKVTPYGSVYFNGFHNADGVNNEDVPLWAVGRRRRHQRHRPPVAFRVSRQRAPGARRQGHDRGRGRLLRRLPDRSAPARTSGRCGCAWPTLASTGPRPRSSSARTGWCSRPVNPTSLACAAIPLFAAAGNPWARIPQVRLERRFGSVLTQAAVLAPQSGDFNSAFLAQPNSGALSRAALFPGPRRARLEELARAAASRERSGCRDTTASPGSRPPEARRRTSTPRRGRST